MKTIRNIAIAMDHIPHRQQLSDLLQSVGYCVIVQASSGKEFINSLEIAAKDSICIIDVKLGPVIDGPELCLQIRSKFPQNKIIGYSMCIDEGIIGSMYENGLNAYVKKGTELDYLLHVISDLSSS